MSREKERDGNLVEGTNLTDSAKDMEGGKKSDPESAVNVGLRPALKVAVGVSKIWDSPAMRAAAGMAKLVDNPGLKAAAGMAKLLDNPGLKAAAGMAKLVDNPGLKAAAGMAKLVDNPGLKAAAGMAKLLDSPGLEAAAGMAKLLDNPGLKAAAGMARLLDSPGLEAAAGMAKLLDNPGLKAAAGMARLLDSPGLRAAASIAKLFDGAALKAAAERSKVWESSSLLKISPQILGVLEDLPKSALRDYLSSDYVSKLSKSVEGEGSATLAIIATGDSRVLKASANLEEQIVDALSSGRSVESLPKAASEYLREYMLLLIFVLQIFVLLTDVPQAVEYLAEKLRGSVRLMKSVR